MPFSFEKLTVYEKALDWVENADSLSTSAKGKVSANLVDQLSRASLSIPLNIAEGNGRWHKAEKRQFFWIARGSTFECASLLQVMKRKGAIEESQYKQSYDRLEEIAKMLSGLIKSTEVTEK